MSSTLLLAIGWAGWHLPALFYVPSYTAIGLRILPGFLLGVLAGAIVLTWLYNSSGGSVFVAVLWHASFNFVTASPNAGGMVAAITSTLVMVWAIVVIWRDDWAALANSPRSVCATREEKTRALPGDERIPQAIDTLTHGVTIRRPPRDVWPWLVQVGAESRAGWYSYDWLDNGRQRSATRIVPDLQHPAVGTILGILHIVWPRLGPERWLNNVIHRESFVDVRHAHMSRITAGDWFRPREGRTDWHRIAKRLNYAPRLGEIMAPTLIVCGRHDPQFPLACCDELARGIENAQLVVLEHSGLFPFVEESGPFIYTQNSPQWVAVLAREDLFWRNMRRAFLGHCGFHPIRRTRLDKVNDVSQAERVKWLDEVKRLGRRGL